MMGNASQAAKDLGRTLKAFLAEMRAGGSREELWNELKKQTLSCLDCEDPQMMRSAFEALKRYKDSVSKDVWKEFTAESQQKLVHMGRTELLEFVQTLFQPNTNTLPHSSSKRRGSFLSNSQAKRPCNATGSEATKTEALQSRGNVAFGDTFFLLKTKGVRNQAHTIALDDIVTAGADFAVICNYKIDIGWMWERAPALQTSRKILVIHGEGTDEELHWRRVLSVLGAADRVRFFRPSTPNYGTVHSKMIMLFFRSGCRICIHTANMIEGDWDYKTQGAYVRDFPLAEASKGASSASTSIGARRCDFSLQLERYIRHMLTGSELNDVTDMLSRYDFSSAGVALVSSVPGVHKGASKSHFGHARLRRVLEQEIMPIDCGHPVAICQFSSLGSIQQKWLEEEFKTTLFTERRSLQQAPVRNGEIKLVYPTVSQVQESNEGLQAGASLPVSGKNMHRDHVTSKLHKWDAQISGRGKAMPHIKTFLRYGTARPESPFWAFLGSFNLSVAAWGRMQGGKKGRSEWDRLNVLSYEIGVLFAAGLACPPAHAVDPSVKFCIPSEQDREIWCLAQEGKNVSLQTSSFTTASGEQVESNNIAARLVLRLPLPYLIPPVKYSATETPWTTEFCSIA